MTDLVTFGETMVRLSPPAGQRLSRMDSLDVHVGGAESNVAATASNLGLEAAWLSVLPGTALGERIAHALRGEGVEPAVTWTEAGRVGTYYFERGGSPRGPTVIYDRAGTPIRTAKVEDIPVERVRGADGFLTSGITLALSDQLAETTAELLGIANDAGVRTAFDVNYRAKLWDPGEARATLVDLFPEVDLLFVAQRDAADVLGLDGGPATVARTLRSRHGFETVVVTRGDEGALAAHDGDVYDQPAFAAETVDPIGSGDAFVGGYLAERLAGGAVPDALASGAATAGLNRTVEGDFAPVSPEEVAAIVDDDGSSGIER
jgi:2-dehydro-3-deoxygluconokinase